MIGRILDNRYEILEKIGGGGMALVYKAKCRLLNRYVAVKILRPEFTSDEDFISKFAKESQAAASLSHPNIVSIYDVGIDNDIYYIVMEYVKGKNLKKYIKEKGPLSNEEVINISKQIALALNHAHANHIIHRDIKPHNILITEDGRVKVTDFGIARAVTSSTVTNTGNVIGSVHYFSPEQARGGFVDEKSDIYSLGVTMYEAATGKVPFSGDTPISVALKHLKEDVIPPSLINRNISKSLESIILKCMQKEKSKRYDSALDLYNDLNRALTDPSLEVLMDFEEDESPTRILPPINDVKLEKREVKAKRNSNKKQLFLGVISALVVSIIFVTAIFYNSFKENFFTKELEIPDLTNVSYEIAKNKLIEMGLKIDLEREQYSKKVEKGYIITQLPKAGEIVKEGYTVRVTVSKGPKMVEMPNLIHKDLDEAKIILENNNLSIKEIIHKYDNDLPVGMVIDQIPKPNTKIEEGSQVNIIVSEGRKIQTIIMPNLVGKNVEDAKSTAKRLQLIINNIDYEYNSDVKKDTVISQSIKPGSEVPENTVLSIVVSKGPEVIQQPPEEQELPPIKKTLIIPLNFDKDVETVKVIKTENGISSTIYEGTHKKEEEILKITVTGNGKVKFDVYFGDKLVYSKEELFE
ncbi:serine/threonine protein kinase [Caminicella sporogenes DSM 14501]|uniref:non-specific serine/threonine protein kinase n=1 Tax=Caminicella sporogenes DSM 14501 TaxID=1121266 RepID=A0A1M6LHQ7_9FIRM|nr:Stk1 family PASTA domain-containing Ser/Thr kinase [Caminicella sporogenes]RKD27833.1 hypothetical protein BET04_01840 [Caminicella sporogenes]SHJ70645.1 serine/threonine protein kinase [Caminicella sporogenes DSM 14501]